MNPSQDLSADLSHSPSSAAPTRPTPTAAGAQPRRWVLPLQLIAAAIGAWEGMGFGQEISGPVLGVLLAANCAFFGSLAVQTLAQVADRLAGLGQTARQD